MIISVFHNNSICYLFQDANVKLIRELRNEIKRLKAIIVAAKLDDSELMVESKSVLAENIHKKEEMVNIDVRFCCGG